MTFEFSDLTWAVAKFMRADTLLVGREAYNIGI